MPLGVRNKTLHDFICCAIAAATTDEFSVKEFQTLKFTETKEGLYAGRMSKNIWEGASKVEKP